LGILIISISLLAVLLIYLALYLASLVILEPIIGYWSNVTAVVFRSIVNSAMLIIYVASPFNAYETLILHVNIFQYFALNVCLPTAILKSFTVGSHIMGQSHHEW